ncbi:MAG: hypothetical protein ACK4FK_05700 [Ferrovibrio sp.]|uniref:hypothetical protein n=1 Tax=Ferrovibrio sp. TaxID=1917215 RepID=UPI0039192BB2
MAAQAARNHLIKNDILHQSPTPEMLVESYASHLEQIAAVFNKHSRDLGLGVRLDASGAVAAVRAKNNYGRVTRFADRSDDSGVLMIPNS